MDLIIQHEYYKELAHQNEKDKPRDMEGDAPPAIEMKKRSMSELVSAS